MKRRTYIPGQYSLPFHSKALQVRVQNNSLFTQEQSSRLICSKNLCNYLPTHQRPCCYTRIPFHLTFSFYVASPQPSHPVPPLGKSVLCSYPTFTLSQGWVCNTNSGNSKEIAVCKLKNFRKTVSPLKCKEQGDITKTQTCDAFIKVDSLTTSN